METFTSPQKRKRTASSSYETPRGQTRLRTDLPSRTLPGRNEEQPSPRTAVSHRMNDLALNRASPSPCAEDCEAPASSVNASDDEPRATRSSDGDMEDDNNIVPLNMSQLLAMAANGHSSAVINPDSPVTPTLAPIPSPAAGPMVSPLRSASSTPSPISTHQREPFTMRPARTERAGTPTKKSAKKSTGASGASAKASQTDRVTKARRRKSPPPTTVVNDLVWTDAEITGHNPDDPDDDMYGINGIGFKPTPAIAEMRHAQRRKQIADWKKREENERRARRRETRNPNDSIKIDDTGGEEERKVRFSDAGEG